MVNCIFLEIVSFLLGCPGCQYIAIVFSYDSLCLCDVGGDLSLSFFKKEFIYFILLALQVFVAVHRLSLVVASGGSSSLWCMGFSLWWLLLVWSTGFGHASFSSCGSLGSREQAQ